MKIFLKIILLIFICKVSLAQSITDSIKDEDKVYYLSLLWSEIKYNYVNMDQINFDSDSLYRAYITKIQSTNNDFKFYQTLKQFVAKFGDGHTEISYNSPFRSFRDYFSMNLMSINEKVYVVRLKKTAECDSTWVGSEVIKISGINTKAYLQDSIFPYISASTKQHLWMQGVHKIHQDFKWKDFVSTIVTRKGDTINIRLPRNGEATRLKTDEYWGIPLPQNREMVEFKYLNDSISYLNIKSFYPEDIVISEIDKNLDKIYKSKGLIIDLRKNGGGVTNVAWYLQSLLSKDKFFLNYSWETRVNDGVKRANSNWKDEYKGYSENQEVRFVEADTIFIPDSIRRIEVPVVILIGKYTFSAAEDFLVNLYEVPNRPTLVGQETGGSTGSPLVVSNLPYQGICRICTRRICFPYSGKRFVNQGIKPDVIVQETIDDILHGNDIALNKALEFFSIK